MSEQIVITGTGAICALGMSLAEIVRAISGGRSALAPVAGWRGDAPDALRAAPLDNLDPRLLVEDRKLHKRVRRTDLLGLYAADRAIADARILESRAALDAREVEDFNDRTAVYSASGGGNYQTQYDFFPLISDARGELRHFGQELSSQVDPMWLLRELPNNVVCHVGIRHGFKGPNCCFVNHSSGGACAISQALDALSDGEADRAIVVAHDTPVEPQTLTYFDALGLMTKSQPRPFDFRHDGIALGDGGAAMVLETRASAERRGARILGTILGVGFASEAAGLLAIRPDGEGPARAVERAFAAAGLAADDIGAVIAHGNGGPNSDDSEAAAFVRIFGSGQPPITSFKWAYGHLLAAAGMIDAVLAVECLRDNELPGIATFERPADASAKLRLSRAAQPLGKSTALTLSRGFGSFNSAVILGAPPARNA
jgi:3-oxoacyl-[acyl-carrier-protein] synthase I